MTLGESNYVKQLDPTIDLSRPVKIRIEEGAEEVTYTKYPSSNVSAQSIQFNAINPPSGEFIVDRKVMVRAAFRLTFTGTNVPNGEYLFQTDGLGEYGDAWSGGLVGGVDALRAYPLSQMLNTLSTKINSQTFTQSLNRYIEPLQRYSGHRDVCEQDWSTTPTMPDQYKQYSNFAVYGSARNALANYGESQFRTPRGGFSGLIVVSQNLVGQPNGTASTGTGDVMEAVIDVEVTEPLFISPLAFGKRSHRGFIGVTTMAITLNFDSQYANYVWSHDEISSGKTINNIQLSFNAGSEGYASNPEIMFRYLTPRMGMKIPRDNIYPYHEINDYLFDNYGAVNAGATQQLSVNNIQLDSVPKRVYIYFRKSPNSKTFNDTDTYARIRNINMTFANKSGLFSDANEQQLYEMSVSNGLLTSWTQWSKHVGSILCIDFARQVSMDHRNVVGKSGSYQMQYRVTLQNISNEAQAYESHTVVVSDGYIAIEDFSINKHNNLGALEQVYDSPLIHIIDWEDFETFYGAGLAEDLRKFMGKIKKGAKKAWEIFGPVVENLAKTVAKRWGPGIVNKIISGIPIGGPAAGATAQQLLEALLGEGDLYAVLESAVDSGMFDPNNFAEIIEAVQGSGIVGGGLVGGKSLSKRNMMKRLKRY